MKINYMAVDQYGEIYRNLGEYPRKELMERLDCKHAEKIYIDKKDGSTIHIGYIIGNLWLTLYQVIPFEKKIK